MIISDIITEVISEVGGDTSDTDLQAKMLIFAKGALRRFPLFSKARLFNITSYATLVAGANYLTTPTYFLDEKQVWYEEDGTRHIIVKKDMDKFSELIRTDVTGKPEYYFISGNVIQFDKNCDADRIIYVEHAGEVDDITAASDFFGSTDMLEILKDGIKATYYTDYVEDINKSGVKLALFKGGLDELEKRNMIQTMGGHIGD